MENAIKIAKDRIEQFEPSRFVGWFRSTTQSNDNEFLDMLKKKQEEVEKIKKESEEKLKKVTDKLEELKNKQTQSNESNSSLESEGSTTATPLDKQRDEEKKAIEKIDY